MKLVIIESPYAGNVDRNLRYLRACLKDSLQRGESPYASHGLLTQPGVLDDNDTNERALGIKAGYEWYRVADAAVFYCDLGWSPGMKLSAEHVKYNAIPFEFRELGGDWGALGEVSK